MKNKRKLASCVPFLKPTDMQYIFLDTNIFIHFVDFEQIEWRNVINTDDIIVITFAPVVIDELDSHKYNKNPKISKRVKKLLPKIEHLIENKANSKYDIKHIDRRPLETTFIKYNLDKREKDDNLIATIIEFYKIINADDRIVFITNDVGPRLKAKSLNIITAKLSENYLLPNEPDEIEIKNHLLQKELNELKNRAPIVSLSFVNKTNIASFKREKQEYKKDEFISNVIREAKQENQYLEFSSPDNDLCQNLMPAFKNNPMFSLSEKQVDDYNNELDRYFKKYETYAKSLFEFFHFKQHSIKIELLLANKGTAPANDIDIEIHFPDGFELLKEDACPKPKKKPDLPYKPKSRLDIQPISIHPSLYSNLSPSHKINLDVFDLTNPTIKKTNSYIVTYHIKNLKHNQTFKLKPLHAKFSDINLSKGFSIDYNLIISNVSNVINGQLNIKFDD